MSNIRQNTINGLVVGDRFSVERTFSREEVTEFARISGDYNPVHCDERFAEAKQFDGLICHGLLVASLITEIGGQIGWLASGMSFKFRKPVYAGDRVRCDFTLTEINAHNRAKAEAVFYNQMGDVVLEASLGGVLPNDNEREILQSMLDEGDPTNGGRSS